MAAQLAGLAASVALLRAIEATGRPEDVVAVWAAVQAAHVALRYQSLAVLRFETLNQKRACACVRAHVAGRAVPGARRLMQTGPYGLSECIRCLAFATCAEACLRLAGSRLAPVRRSRPRPAPRSTT